jgi:hypothetical protein
MYCSINDGAVIIFIQSKCKHRKAPGPFLDKTWTHQQEYHLMHTSTPVPGKLPPKLPVVYSTVQQCNHTIVHLVLCLCIYIYYIGHRFP